jgi:acyl-CoA dehydrogenase
VRPSSTAAPGEDGVGQELADLLTQILGRDLSRLGDGVRGATWSSLEQAGLLRLGIPEEQGGTGGTVEDAALALGRCAEAGIAGPLCEMLFVAGGFVRGTHLEVPDGVITAAVPERSGLRVIAERSGVGWALRGTLPAVAWAEAADALFVAARSENGPVVAVLERAGYRCAPGPDVAGEPRDAVEIDCVVADDKAAVRDAGDLRSRAALGRSVQMLGAQRACMNLTIAQVARRTQFGRRLDANQVIRHMLAELVSEVAATEAAVRAALDALGLGGGSYAERVSMLAAIARVQAARAATVTSAIAHQLHGAIGVTDEYPLHHFTSRLWAWRDENGTEHEWAVELASMSVRAGDLWTALTG